MFICFSTRDTEGSGNGVNTATKLLLYGIFQMQFWIMSVGFECYVWLNCILGAYSTEMYTFFSVNSPLNFLADSSFYIFEA